MKDAFAGIVASYSELTGTSKVVLLFLVSVIAIILINENFTEDDERRKISPAVFLASIFSGIAYAAVSLTHIIAKSQTVISENNTEKPDIESDKTNSETNSKNAESGKKSQTIISRLEAAACVIFISAMIILSGGFVISRALYESSMFGEAGTLIKVLGGLCMIIYLAIYYMISRQLFKKKSERTLFIYFVILLHLFADYSEMAMGISMIMAPVAAASIIIHGVLPVVTLLYLTFEDKIKTFIEADTEDENASASYDENGVLITDSEEIPEEWDMKKHKILNMRNMAVAFLAFFILFMAAIFVLNSKINSLYEATILLENAANTKMTVDEHKDANGVVDVTIMVSPDGNVTVIGGGEKTSGTEVYEMISKYADKVDKWYLYGEDNRGAYDFCIEQGIEVPETYILSGVEKLAE